MKRVDLAGVAIDEASGVPIALLQEHDAPHRLLPIVIGGPEAASIAVAVSGHEPPRPLTHDLMASLLESLDTHLDAVEVTEVRNGTFVARLALSGAGGDRRLDSRPSDAIALAVRMDAPLLVHEAVLDEAGSLPPTGLDDPALDESTIDEEVAAFRSFLDEIDPTEFVTEERDNTGPEEDTRSDEPELGPQDPVGEAHDSTDEVGGDEQQDPER